MSSLIEFPLEDGSSLWVEVSETTPRGLTPAGRGDLPSRASQTFEAALERVRPAAQAVIQKLRSLHDAPDEIEVEFGLKLSAEAGAVIAAGGVEANYKVTLKWKREEKKAA